MTPSTQYYITLPLLAKKGTGEVDTRHEQLHTTPADRQDIDHPALFKEGPRVVKTNIGEKQESDNKRNKTQQLTHVPVAQLSMAQLFNPSFGSVTIPAYI
jgi:hypothetical protein